MDLVRASNEYPAGWFRLWRNGPGLSWTKARPLPSERWGIHKPILRFRGWRVFFLERFPG